MYKRTPYPNKKVVGRSLSAICLAVAISDPCSAQRTADNATTAAPDAFGTTVGDETIGLYSDANVRGFDPSRAGNVRIEGLYFDQVGVLSDRLIDTTNIRVGLSALNFQLPAPSGVVDQKLRIPSGTLATTSFGFGDYFGPFVAVDGGVVSHDRKWTIGYGARVDFPSRNEAGGSSRVLDLSALVRFRPSDRIELTVFGARQRTTDADSTVTIYSSGSFLPPTIKPRVKYSQPWATSDTTSVNIGTIGNVDLGAGWSVTAGLFDSTLKPAPGLAEQFVDVSRAGVGTDQVIFLNPKTRYRSYSGELRVSKTLHDGDRIHLLSLGARGRSSRQQYGGDDLETIGTSTLDELIAVPEPTPSYGSQTVDRVRQVAATASYRLDWAKVGLLNIGVQKVRFEKTTQNQQDIAGTSNRGVSSPFLFNVGAGVQIFSKLILFGSYSKGLEEGGTAPQSAPNRNTVLPVVITRQADLGTRWEITPSTTLIGAVFTLRRPFADLNPSDGNRYEFVGQRRNKGAEVSLRTVPLPGLSVVAGAVFLRSKLEGPGVEGLTPIGTIGHTVQINANYAVAQVPGLSFDASYSAYHDLAATRDNTAKIPDRAILSLGVRYRFDCWNAKHLIRFYFGNVTNRFGWNVADDGGFQYNRPRRVNLSLTSDW